MRCGPEQSSRLRLEPTVLTALSQPSNLTNRETFERGQIAWSATLFPELSQLSDAQFLQVVGDHDLTLLGVGLDSVVRIAQSQ